ncbi:hypothetical protein LINPERPRIM_LOCUS14617 [Linum perenne]
MPTMCFKCGRIGHDFK